MKLLTLKSALFAATMLFISGVSFQANAACEYEAEIKCDGNGCTVSGKIRCKY